MRKVLSMEEVAEVRHHPTAPDGARRGASANQNARDVTFRTRAHAHAGATIPGHQPVLTTHCGKTAR